MREGIEYDVFEDNGGGLHLCVLEKGACVYTHTHYELSPGQLTEDLNEIWAGGDVKKWDGNEENPQEIFEDLLRGVEKGNGGVEIIANEMETFFECMGIAGLSEFKRVLENEGKEEMA